MYCKRNNSDQWHGPGTVIGKDEKQVLVRHGGIYVRAHVCWLQYASSLSQSVSTTACGNISNELCSPKKQKSPLDCTSDTEDEPPENDGN